MLKDLKKAHLLVTGGAGFMGSSFIRYLLWQKDFQGKITNLDLFTYAANKRHVDPFGEDPRYELVIGDIGDHSLLDQIQKRASIDGIVHFAAQTHVDRSIASGKSFVDTNIVGTCQLLEWVKRNQKVHFHHVSTDEVYGSLKDQGRFTTNSPYSPSSPYAASKAASDHLVRAYAHTFDLSCTISQSCNNYGPCQFPEKFVPLMMLGCLDQEPLPIYGNGRHRREWLFVTDHSSAIATILERGQSRKTYPITSGFECSNLTLLSKVIDAASKQTGVLAKTYKSLITFVPDRPGHDFRYALDQEPMAALGWKAATTIEEGMVRVAAWYSAHRNRVDKGEEGRYSWRKEEFVAQ